MAYSEICQRIELDFAGKKACLYECPGSIYCSNPSVSGGVSSGGGDSKMLRFYAKVSCDERGTCRQVILYIDRSRFKLLVPTPPTSLHLIRIYPNRK